MDTVCNQSYDFFFHFKIDKYQKNKQGGKGETCLQRIFSELLRIFLV